MIIWIKNSEITKLKPWVCLKIGQNTQLHLNPFFAWSIYHWNNHHWK